MKVFFKTLLFGTLLASFTFAARGDNEEISILEFFNTDVQQVINYVAEITGYTIVMDPSVRGKVSISTKEKVTVKKSIELIQSLLQNLGYTLEGTGTILKVVPLKDISLLKDLYTNISQFPPTENRILTLIRQVQGANGDSLLKNIKPFLSKYGNIIYDPNSQKLLLSDFKENLLSINKLIDQLDVSAAEEEGYSEIVTLKNIETDQLVKILQASLVGTEVEDSRYPATRRISPLISPASQKKSRIQIVPLDKGNQILLVGSKQKVQEVIKMIRDLEGKVSPLDRKVDYEIVRLGIFDLNEVQTLFSRIIGGARTGAAPGVRLTGKVELIPLPQKGLVMILGEEDDRRLAKSILRDLEEAVVKNQTPSLGTSLRMVPIQYRKSSEIISILNQLKNQSGKPVTAADFDVIDSTVNLIDDQQANSILIKAPEGKMSTILNLVREIDARVTQVLIEVQIIEVSFSRDSRLGIDFDNLNTANILPSLAPDLAFSIKSITHGVSPLNASLNSGLSIGFNNSRAIINALSTVARVNVVSTPNLLTLDNKKAEIKITDRKAITKDEIQYDATPTSAGKFTKTHEYKDAGIKLTISPRINDISNVSLAITLDVDDFKDSGEAGFPDISTRNISSEIIIQDSTTAILGGLIKNKVSSSAKGIPGVTEVPVLRNIFGTTADTTLKTELLIFLTPHIIANDETLRRLSDKKLIESLYRSLPQVTESERIKLEQKKKQEADKAAREAKLKKNQPSAAKPAAPGAPSTQTNR
ncbi:MAG: hypothetical protein JNM63_06070 [Spirochaetia bacterium]|nr:hypothetical protein [Spirochaetia bacterium]